MLIMLTDRRQKIEKEILMIDKEAKELEATIPPPKSICEGYHLFVSEERLFGNNLLKEPSNRIPLWNEKVQVPGNFGA